VANLVHAAEDQSFSKQQIEAELGGDIYAHIRARIDSLNAEETARLKRDGR
jgi:hypothetical protein